MTAALWKEDVELGEGLGNMDFSVSYLLSDFVYTYTGNHEKVSFSATTKRSRTIKS